MKEEISENLLCEGLPSEFRKFLKYAKNLSYEAKPDYQKWVNKFRLLYVKPKRYSIVAGAFDESTL